MSKKVYAKDFPEQTVYLKDHNGDYIRHTFGTDEFWRLSPDKQVAIRYDILHGRGKEGNAPHAIEKGWVRAFRGSVEEFFNFLVTSHLIESEILFQDRELHDECQVRLGHYNETGEWVRNYTTAAQLGKDLIANDAYEVFEGHLIFFTTDEPAWHADTQI